MREKQKNVVVMKYGCGRWSGVFATTACNLDCGRIFRVLMWKYEKKGNEEDGKWILKWRWICLKKLRNIVVYWFGFGIPVFLPIEMGSKSFCLGFVLAQQQQCQSLSHKTVELVSG